MEGVIPIFISNSRHSRLLKEKMYNQKTTHHLDMRVESRIMLNKISSRKFKWGLEHLFKITISHLVNHQPKTLTATNNMTVEFQHRLIAIWCRTSLVKHSISSCSTRIQILVYSSQLQDRRYISRPLNRNLLWWNLSLRYLFQCLCHRKKLKFMKKRRLIKSVLRPTTTTHQVKLIRCNRKFKSI